MKATSTLWPDLSCMRLKEGLSHFQDISHIHSNQSLQVNYYRSWWDSHSENLSAVLAIYNTPTRPAKWPAWTWSLRFLRIQGKSIHFSPLTTSCWTAPCLCSVVYFVLYLLKRVRLIGVIGSTLGPLTPSSSMPLSTPSAQHHFFVRTPPEL